MNDPKTPAESLASAPSLLLETAALAAGYRRLAGVDEAGRGPLAGPVVAAAVSAEERNWTALAGLGLRDSKLLSPSQRARLYEAILPLADVGIGVIGAATIDRLGIVTATFLAMQRAVERLRCPVEFVLVDGNRVPDWSHPARAIIDGDRLCLLVAAASIVAKVTRDRIMAEVHALYPVYGFDRHKGYGTALHLERLQAHGPCPAHRVSFAPLRTARAVAGDGG